MNLEHFPNNFQDPYDRLNELEAVTQGMGSALEDAAEQLQTHSRYFTEISEGLMQMARAFETLKLENRSLHQQTQNLHHRLRILENKEDQNDSSTT